MSETMARIQAAQVAAMKAKEEVRLSTVRLIRSALKNLEIEKRPATTPLTETEVVGVLQKIRKQMLDSIEQFKQGSREDLAQNEAVQLKIVEEFLPVAMSEADLARLIDETAKEVEAASIKDMGKLVKAVLAKGQGRADGKMVSDLVKKKLS